MKNILSLIPVIQAASLVEENVKVSKKAKTKDMLDLGLKNIIGINLIKIESGLISGL